MSEFTSWVDLGLKHGFTAAVAFYLLVVELPAVRKDVAAKLDKLIICVNRLSTKSDDDERA